MTDGNAATKRHQPDRYCGQGLHLTGSETKSFEVHSGVRQGFPLSLTLFNFVIDWIPRNALAGLTGVKISATLALVDLAYADDIAILGESYEAGEYMVNGIHRFANGV